MSDRSPTAADLALYERAREVRERAYAPYSEFPVGAVLIAEDGRAFEGVNVENGSFGLTICAERTACVRAVAEGARRFSAIGVATHDSARTGSPCGACRQFLSEFGLDLRVVYLREGEVVAEPLSALLPAAFELGELNVRSGFVGLAGRPNVGKSTLTNALTGAHVAIVSDKPQTTRRRALGVVHGDDYQIVLVDLPGFQRPFDALTRRMQRSVDDGLRDVDAVLLVLDATESSGAGDRFIAGQLAAAGAPVVIALNKVDRLRPPAVLEAIAAVSGLLEEYVALHPVSARTLDGIPALESELAALLPEGPAYFEPGVDSDQPLERRIAELVREQALARTREEVPHAIAVMVEEVRPPRGKHAGRVTATLIVEASSQQGILVGKDGATVRAIGSAARPPIEDLLGGAIFLDLRVKVRPGWRRDEALLERFGL